LSTAPSITKLKNKPNFKIEVAAKVRGVVDCNNCRKPRCIYSHAVVSLIKPPLNTPNNLNCQRDKTPPTTEDVHQYQAMAKGRLIDATESTIFICGMAPLDPDDPFHDIFLCDTSLDCDMDIDSSFYVSRILPLRLELCCHCAGVFESPIDLNNQLNAPEGPYSVVLPICKACLKSGCHIIVRSARANAKAVQARLDRRFAKEVDVAMQAKARACTSTTTLPNANASETMPASRVEATSATTTLPTRTTPTMPRTNMRNKRTATARSGGKRTKRKA